MAIRLSDPFAAILAVQNAMENAMRSDWLGTRTSGPGVYPPVNVFRQGEDFVIVAELPGVSKEDLDIQVKGDQVRLVGKKTVEYDENVSIHRRERASGEFDRTLTISAQIDASKVQAKFDNGLLAIRLPRAESDKARSISID